MQRRKCGEGSAGTGCLALLIGSSRMIDTDDTGKNKWQRLKEREELALKAAGRSVLLSLLAQITATVLQLFMLEKFVSHPSEDRFALLWTGILLTLGAMHVSHGLRRDHSMAAKRFKRRWGDREPGEPPAELDE